MNAQALKKARKLTYEDFMKIPYDGKQYELYKGDLFMVPAPSIRHQDIVVKLDRNLGVFVEKNNLGKLFVAPCDVVFSDNEIVKPDIIYISNKNLSIIKELNIQGVPDFLIEIISPTTSYNDKKIKKQIYEKYGVEEYWIIDPVNETLEVFVLEKGKYKLDDIYSKNDKVKVKSIEGLEVDLKRVFSEG